MRDLFRHTTPSQRLKILLFLGALQILAYYFAGSMLTPRPFSVALPQPDTLLYCQSAKQVALGQPFVFTPGEAPSTGCTSHLYPFLLAVPYLLGMKGATLLLGGFILNALLYLVFLYAWHHIFETLLEDDRARLCATLLLGLFGQSASCAFGQTDTGVIMAVTSGVFAAWLKNRRILFGILLALSPWCRPEGMMLIVGFGAVLVWSFLLAAVRSRLAAVSDGDDSSRVMRHASLAHGDFVAVCIAALSAAGVFVFNYFLTGQFQFHSVEFKGYFGNQPFSDALASTMTDFLTMVRQLLLGQPADGSVRTTFFLPLFGALFAWIGVFSFHWRRGVLPLAGWLLACLICILSVASGAWQETNFDRYLAWLMPTGLAFIAAGTARVADWTRGKIRWEAMACLVVAFQCAGAVALLGLSAKAARMFQLDYETCEAMEAAMDGKGAVGLDRWGGAAYPFGERTIRHLSGFYSPAFRNRETVCNLEMLKHERENRFAYWFSTSSNPALANWGAFPLVTNQVFQGLNQFTLWKTDWTCLDLARKPCATNLSLDGLVLADRVDVGYVCDEKRTDFSVNYRLPGISYRAFAMDGECDGKTLVEVGRPVIGWADMRVRLKPGADAVMVVRMAAKAEGVRAHLYAPEQVLSLKAESRLNVFVDGEAVTSLQAKLTEGDGRFTEVAFRIPGGAIRNETSLVQIFGDHLAFCYWFYQ